MVGRWLAIHEYAPNTIMHAHHEDTVALYGFLREDKRTLFRDLQKVSGIGARIALAVLSGVLTSWFARLVQAGNVAALTGIPGIGKKAVERIVVKLRDRVAEAIIRKALRMAPER